MGQDRIDASVGLSFSLLLFERYRKNGLLQAELHHVPGIRGRCMGYLHLVEGKVITCYLEDKQGNRYSASKDMLMRVDDERGPFEWVLQPLPAPSSVMPQEAITPRLPFQDSPVPTPVAVLDVERLEGWSTRHKLMLSMVYDAVDGQRSVKNIKAEVPLPEHLIDDALRILCSLRVIDIPLES